MLRQQRKQLEGIDLSDEEVERALEPMISFRNQLREEIETCKQMRRGGLSRLQDLRGIGRWLIGARIAKGWSLSRLADELDVSLQQVSREEQNEHGGITTCGTQRILDALGVHFRLKRRRLVKTRVIERRSTQGRGPLQPIPDTEDRCAYHRSAQDGEPSRVRVSSFANTPDAGCRLLNV
ncbi:helix-turn-helix domain-containing protein [Salinibacter altiplanensis]|uniref:helix-turn-helix domain-containing protein n=1 Tax=Salinibacter altiplanensis TaxID=1803181 RepID=UPI000C9F37F0|nr:helix-turn-helix domain-containing protein [Salinibacter altiplanensis]